MFNLWKYLLNPRELVGLFTFYSDTLSAAAIAQFDAEVKHAYQNAGLIRGTVRTRTGVVGSTHRFPKLGKGTATARVTQTDVVPMNVAHTNATATLTDWNAPEYTDIFDQAKVNFDERQELATTIAGAIGRREDQLILAALDAASSTLTVANDIGGTDSAMNTAKARRCKRLLDDRGGPPADPRTMLVSAFGLEDMLGNTDVTSSDFNTVKALVNGELNTWLGFKWVMMETRDEGGLVKDGSNDRTTFAYKKSSTGLAIGIDFKTEVNYIPEKTSWLSNGLFSAGAVAIDAFGIVEMVSRESA